MLSLRTRKSGNPGSSFIYPGYCIYPGYYIYPDYSV